MINSNDRKLCLSGWLRENNKNEYDTPLKLQKFLLFYECFSKVNGEEADFSNLKGYVKGPVFSKVWGDYTKERNDFDLKSQQVYNDNSNMINDRIAKKCAFLVKILTENELSDLTHQLHLWNAKEEQINNRKYQVSLSEADFNNNDFKIIKTLDAMYPDQMIKASTVIPIGNYHFVINNEDMRKINIEHYEALITLSNTEELSNPVYVEFDEEGRLLID